jgi:two-component system cell cycle sensor histidine kinase/response regulator CckA
MDIQPYHDQDRRQLFQGANQIVYAHDLAGNFTFLNHTGEAMSGYSCSEICDMNIAELLPAEIAEHIHEQIFSNLAGRVGAVYEIDLIAKDGHRVPLEVSTALVLRNGQPIGVQGIAVPSVIRSDS